MILPWISNIPIGTELGARSSKNMVKFYNGRGTAEQWIKEGKNAANWTKLSCRTFRDNQPHLQLFALTYNLANFLQRLALPRDVQHWSLTTLRKKLAIIVAKVTRHSIFITFQIVELALPGRLFSAILDQIAELAIPPAPYKTLFVKTFTRADPGSRETKGAYKSSSLYGDL
ncbi:hypothetical protein F1728_24445 [Gimesia benthica]|uniref:Transposase DDE domain-containing protein n=1 Tax=Gimesia benthica TaxID=2608982 RepID=A0A6I6AHB0_9PLAN|nr:transposase [Gimesia benthica]QGQ25638.1 hypothetical protein F1728_24445 [Gimesia benthica]